MGFTGGSVGITINNVQRVDWLSYSGSVNWNCMRSTRGTTTIPFEIPAGDPFAPQVGETMVISDAGANVWAGFIQSIEATWIGDRGHHIVIVTGATFEALFDTAQLDKIEYSTGTDSGGLTAPIYAGDIVADLLTRSGVTQVTAGTINQGPEIKSLQVTNIWQGFQDLALQAGFVCYIDPADQKLYFHAATDRTVPFSLTSPDVIWETMDFKQASSDFRQTQVIQLPGVAEGNLTDSFSGDGHTTSFTLSDVPLYLVKADIQPGGLGTAAVAWNPAAQKLTVTPAPPAGTIFSILYAPSSQVIVGAPLGSGLPAGRSTRTQTFTVEGATQEATAALALYSQMPSTLSFQTDKPGIGIARALTIALTSPANAAALLNGTWLVIEVDGAVVPGLDQRDEPFGHWRYTIYLVNTAATAVFPGDGVTTTFPLPAAATFVSGGVTNNPLPGWLPAIYGVIPGPSNVTVTPAPPRGQSFVAQYTTNVSPTSPSFVQTLENTIGAQVSGEGAGAASGLGSGAVGGGTGPSVPYKRTLDLYDTTVGDDIAEHTSIYVAGVGVWVLANLRIVIAADLVVRINKAGEEMITVTVPHTTPITDTLEFPLLTGSPEATVPFTDKEVMTADVVSSSGESDPNGVCQFTVEWSSAAGI